MRGWQLATVGIALSIVLVGCTQSVNPGGAPPTPAPSPAATATADAAAAAQLDAAAATYAGESPTNAEGWQRVLIPEASLRLDVPEGWQRQGDEWAWAPPGGGTERLVVVLADVGPGWQAESMLPSDSRLLDSEPVDLGWAQATSYTVEVTAQGGDAQYVEELVVATIGERAFVFSLRAPDAAALAQQRPSLQHLLDSIAIGEGA